MVEIQVSLLRLLSLPRLPLLQSQLCFSMSQEQRKKNLENKMSDYKKKIKLLEPSVMPTSKRKQIDRVCCNVAH